MECCTRRCSPNSAPSCRDGWRDYRMRKRMRRDAQATWRSHGKAGGSMKTSRIVLASILVFGAATMVQAGNSSSDDKDKEKKEQASEQTPIRVCVAQIR